MIHPSETIARVHVHIRWMIRRDLPSVLAIESASFEYPRAEDEFLRALRQRNCIGMVAEGPGGRIVGYFLHEMHPDHFDIINFAVAPEARRLGVGRQMIAKMAGKLSSWRRTRLVSRCRETALPAHLFFHAQGFRAVGVLREHYEDTGEDAYEFEYRIDGGATEGGEER
jgi:ribosomal-protein-alanine N-acetyltransferase